MHAVWYVRNHAQFNSIYSKCYIVTLAYQGYAGKPAPEYSDARGHVVWQFLMPNAVSPGPASALTRTVLSAPRAAVALTHGPVALFSWIWKPAQYGSFLPVSGQGGCSTSVKPSTTVSGTNVTVTETVLGSDGVAAVAFRNTGDK